MDGMNNRFWRWVAGSLLCLPGMIVAETLLTVRVQTPSGQPVANAVIEAASPAARPFSEAAVMDQVNRQFKPHVLTVAAGQSVSFPNSDDIRHHVYSFSKPKPFELKLYSGEPEQPIVFDRPGVVVLGCNIHDSMVGYIYVCEHQACEQTDKQGVAQLNTSQLPSQLNVWHPRLDKDKHRRRQIDVPGTLKPGEPFVIELDLLAQEKKSESKFPNSRYRRYGR